MTAFKSEMNELIPFVSRRALLSLNYARVTFDASHGLQRVLSSAHLPSILAKVSVARHREISSLRVGQGVSHVSMTILVDSSHSVRTVQVLVRKLRESKFGA